jgi:hypothetical protein
VAYYGYKPAEQAIQIGDNTIVSADIADGSIVNADLNSSAAIAMSKTQLVAGTGLTLSTNTLNVDAAQTGITSVGTIGTGVWNGTKVASAYLDDDTAHLSGTQTFTGDKTFSDNVIITTADDDTTTALKVLALDDGGYTGTVLEVYGTRGPTGDYNIAKFGTNAGTAKFTISGNGDSTFAEGLTVGGSLNGSDATFAGNVSITSSSNVYLSIDTTQSNGDEWQIFNAVSGTTSGLQFKDIDTSKLVMLLQEDGKVGIGTASPKMAISIASANGAPATSGTTPVGNLRIEDSSSTDNVLDMGTYDTSPYGAWLQVTDRANLSLEYPLILQPNGGKVGIGDTSPTAQLTIRSGHDQLELQDSDSGNGWWLGTGSDADLYFATSADSANTRVYFKADGNVGIGETSPDARLEVSIDNGSTYAGHFKNSNGTAPTLWVEATGNDNNDTGVFKVDVNGSTRFMVTNNYGIALFGKTSSSVNVAGGYIYGGEAIMSIANSANTYLVRSTDTSAYTFYVGGDGEISAVTTSITSLSDERLKENIIDLETGLTEIMALKPRRFDWKEGEGSDKKNLVGFVAQEVETVLPDLIGDYKHEELDEAKTIRMGDMLPTLVKAIQELKAENDELKKRIEALENA